MKLTFWEQYDLNKPCRFKVEFASGKLGQRCGLMSSEVSAECSLVGLCQAAHPLHYQMCCLVLYWLFVSVFLRVIFGGNKTMSDSTISREYSVIKQEAF